MMLKRKESRRNIRIKTRKTKAKIRRTRMPRNPRRRKTSRATKLFLQLTNRCRRSFQRFDQLEQQLTCWKRNCAKECMEAHPVK